MASPASTSGVLAIPAADSDIAPTSVEELDEAVATLKARGKDWVGLSPQARIDLLQQSMYNLHQLVDEWEQTAGPPKGITPGSPQSGEDLATGPMILMRHLRVMRDTMTNLRDNDEVKLPKKVKVRPDGQVVVPVFPTGKLDLALTPMHTAEVWMQPHVTEATLVTGRVDDQPGAGGVSFVLGSGNIPSIGVSDALTKLFNDGEVCIIKMNPVNAHMGPILEKAMSPFIREGFLRIVYGGVEQGIHLTGHPDVDTIHMTASDKTHDVVVFGPGEEGARRKAANERLLDKHVTSELGNVTPIIIVPGVWTDAEIEYQAKNLVTMMASNAGFNCGAARMIVTHPRWKQRQQLLDAVRTCLAEAPQRDAYYPGARDRWDHFTAAHPEAEWFGSDAPGEVPFTFIPNLDASKTDDVMFQTECFNAIFGEVPIDAPTDVPTWLAAAVEFCNETLWGTLVASILCKPASMKDPAVKEAVEQAIADLRYGSIGLNCWGATSYGLVSTTWGAFPGHPDNDIQSGQGVVHNSYLLKDPQKSVVRAPWKLGDKPPLSYDHNTMPEIARGLIEMEYTGSFRPAIAIVKAGIKA